jgi:hypothetical protein
MLQLNLPLAILLNASCSKNLLCFQDVTKLSDTLNSLQLTLNDVVSKTEVSGVDADLYGFC